MSMRVEVLLATMHQTGFGIADEMNVHSPMVIANQSDAFRYEESPERGIRMLTTATRGVGLNRNLGLDLAREEILLFSDDDMVYYEGYEQQILDAYRALPEADAIIFSFDMFQNGKKKDTYLNRTQRIHLTNALKFGTCALSIRRQAVLKAGLHFSQLFGGGTLYSSGEDSLFILDCLRSKLNMYTHEAVIGKNVCKPSTWFSGYNEKYFFDKGAWLSSAFPVGKRLMQLYFGLRFRGLSSLPFAQRMKLMNAGISHFAKLITYEEWSQKNA